MSLVACMFLAALSLLRSTTQPAPAETVAIPALGEAVGDVELAAERGREGLSTDAIDLLQLSTAEQQANLTDNVIYSSVTGENAVSHGAFSGASGIATLIQNSGNQVIIQNALVLNLNLE